ncbi:hypothetical protein ACEWY4_015102 [Coilia grayii]|uniref:Rootletin-like coiled-coil domain-containing protein n=1 Tax=Coilia grayii TaxID=363190 RepID=A0ABD1JU37_9TELE
MVMKACEGDEGLVMKACDGDEGLVMVMKACDGDEGLVMVMKACDGDEGLVMKACDGDEGLVMKAWCSSLSQVNALLRQQLEQAAAANEALKQSLNHARQDAQHKDTRHRREQETSASRLGREQARVRVLWRQAASLRTSFTQLRALTDRNLADMRAECVSVGRELRAACLSLELSVGEHSAPGGVEVSALEVQLRGKLRETMQLQARWDAEKLELNSSNACEIGLEGKICLNQVNACEIGLEGKICLNQVNACEIGLEGKICLNQAGHLAEAQQQQEQQCVGILELTEMVKHLRGQNSEKESDMSAMQASLDRMELSRAGEREERDGLLSEIGALQHLLHCIGQVARGDGDGAVVESTKQEADGPPFSPARGVSPQRDSTLQAVQQALTQRHAQIQELHVRLEGALEQVGALRGAVREGEEARRALEVRGQEVQQESLRVERALEESRRDAQRCRTSLKLVSSEKVVLEQQVCVLEQQVCVLREQLASREAELGAELEVERGRGLDMLRQQRDDLETQLNQHRAEAHRGQRQVEELEERYGEVRKEVVGLREALCQLTLHKEVLEDEKASLAQAISKVRQQQQQQHNNNNNYYINNSLAHAISKVRQQQQQQQHNNNNNYYINSSLGHAISKVRQQQQHNNNNNYYINNSLVQAISKVKQQQQQQHNNNTNYYINNRLAQAISKVKQQQHNNNNNYYINNSLVQAISKVKQQQQQQHNNNNNYYINNRLAQAISKVKQQQQQHNN